VLYEPALRLDNIDDLDWTVIDEMQSALDAGGPDRALELFFPVAGIVDQEIQALRSLDPNTSRATAVSSDSGGHAGRKLGIVRWVTRGEQRAEPLDHRVVLARNKADRSPVSRLGGGGSPSAWRASSRRQQRGPQRRG
jgi:hypothetical protein